MKEYSDEFWQHLEALTDASHLHKCLDCGVVDGGHRYDKKGRPMPKPVIVRLALKDPSKPPNQSSNIAYYCTTCRRPGREWQPVKRQNPKELPSLFG